MGVSPAGDLAATIQQAMPAIPPLTVPGIPQMPAPPATGPGSSNWWCQTFPNSILCKGGITTPGGPTPGTPSGGNVCSIPLIGKYACDLGSRIGFTALAIILIAIGVYVLLGGGLTVIAPEVKPITADLSKTFTRKKAVAS